MISYKKIMKDIKEVENTILISEIQKNVSFSAVFRNYLISIGFGKLSNYEIKGEYCYDGYYKDYFNSSGNIAFTIYCYCYDLREILDVYDKLQFVFESQMESSRGIIGIETIQWVSDGMKDAITNLKYFEEKNIEIYKIMGSIPIDNTIKK